MSYEKLRRVHWRLAEKHPSGKCFLRHVREAIHKEIGLDERTVDKYVKLLIEHKLLKRINKHTFKAKERVL